MESIAQSLSTWTTRRLALRTAPLPTITATILPPIGSPPSQDSGASYEEVGGRGRSFTNSAVEMAERAMHPLSESQRARAATHIGSPLTTTTTYQDFGIENAGIENATSGTSTTVHQDFGIQGDKDGRSSVGFDAAAARFAPPARPNGRLGSTSRRRGGDVTVEDETEPFFEVDWELVDKTSP